MTVSLLEILAAARAHAAPLAAESAGYLLLAVADHVAVAPRGVSPEDVELLQDGSIRLRSRRAAGESDEALERSVRGLLARALEVSSSVGPALRRAGERRESVGLTALVRELENALIPVNRSAAKRALSRLHRETERARDAGKLDSALRRETERTSQARPPEPSPAVEVALASVVEPLLAAAEFPEPSPVASPVALPAVVAAPPPPPVVVAAPTPPPPSVAKARAPLPVLTLTPEPQIAVGEPAFTKPEPVVLRKRERGSRTPQLGTLITAQTLPDEESERTEPAPTVEEADEAVAVADEAVAAADEAVAAADEAVAAADEAVAAADEAVAAADEAVAAADEAVAAPDEAVAAADEAVWDEALELEIDVELEEPVAAAAVPAPLLDPEPSQMPDVVMAMVQLHAGVDADEAPTRLRDVVTAVAETPVPRHVEATHVVVEPPEPEPVWAEAEPLVVEPEAEPVWAEAEPLVVEPEPVVAPSEPQPEPEPEPVVVEEAFQLFQSELAAPELHEALTWDPGPVEPGVVSSLPATFLIAEPAPEPSPYTPAVLPARSSDVSELLDSFYVSEGAEEHELRSALKEMAGLSLTPMPIPLIEEG